MSSFGEHLRQQREMRGISLDEIVATTKIGRRLLVALEEGQFDLLPGGIFNKSYVRAYAKCIGIDEEEAVTAYLEAANEAPPDAKLIAQQHASIHSDRVRDGSGFPLVPVLVLVVVAIGGVAGWKMYQQHKREREQRKPEVSVGQTSTLVPTAVPNIAATAPAKGEPAPQDSVSQSRSGVAPEHSAGVSNTFATPPAAQPSSSEAASSQATAALFEVTVRPKDRAWVSIKSDGKYLVRGIIQPPQVKTVHASNQVVFFTGNAGAVDVDFNGKTIPLAGGADQEQLLVFGPHGLLPKTGAP